MSKYNLRESTTRGRQMLSELMAAIPRELHEEALEQYNSRNLYTEDFQYQKKAYKKKNHVRRSRKILKTPVRRSRKIAQKSGQMIGRQSKAKKATVSGFRAPQLLDQSNSDDSDDGHSHDLQTIEVVLVNGARNIDVSKKSWFVLDHHWKKYLQ